MTKINYKVGDKFQFNKNYRKNWGWGKNTVIVAEIINIADSLYIYQFLAHHDPSEVGKLGNYPVDVLHQYIEPIVSSSDIWAKMNE